jgi:threonine/homoserine/homoserine lactone efflux protein
MERGLATGSGKRGDAAANDAAPLARRRLLGRMASWPWRLHRRFSLGAGGNAGAGALLNTPRVRFLLAIVSFVLLLFLAGMFALRAWRCARSPVQDTRLQGDEPNNAPQTKKFGAYLLGLIMALTSPWNLGLWLAVIGGQQSVTRDSSFGNSLAFAGAVVLGAVIWTLVFSVALKGGGRIFARPAWQAATQTITSLLMLFFAAKLLLTLL